MHGWRDDKTNVFMYLAVFVVAVLVAVMSPLAVQDGVYDEPYPSFAQLMFGPPALAIVFGLVSVLLSLSRSKTPLLALAILDILAAGASVAHAIAWFDVNSACAGCAESRLAIAVYGSAALAALQVMFAFTIIVRQRKLEGYSGSAVDRVFANQSAAVERNQAEKEASRRRAVDNDLGI